MFDAEITADLRHAAQALVDAPIELATTEQLAEVLGAVASTQALLDGVLARGLAHFSDAGGPEAAGAANAKAWARRELRLDAGETGRLITAARTTQALPRVAESLRAGRIRLDHVHEFSAGLKKADPVIITSAEDYLLDVAERSEPSALRAEIREFIEAVHPESLDAAYIRGMDKRDLQVSKVGDGYAVTGFLDIVTGARLKTVLDHLGAPDDRDDRRPPSERRVTNLDRLLTQVLEHGLPSRNGFRPQLYVTVDLERLQGMPGAEPARLHGWGSIPDLLLGRLLCDTDVTPILTGAHVDDGRRDHGGHNHEVPDQPSDRRRPGSVLDVGRSQRLATPQQRIAITHAQGGRCANPGCHNTFLELHHIDWWHRDHGTTDVDNLIGLCPRCHHLLHAGLLHARREPDTGDVILTTGEGHRLSDSDDRDRALRRLLVRRRLREIRQLVHSSGIAA
ncbi:DUF222 domain-containing protein [Mumia sp. zg.B53]|uniref:HNH endonuclease n=1 Tax=Mumia sp. zg.B53 TaxID=2855449 RepID=UPI001C6EA5C6|nr:HNH endonuclease [Mumia sp. zg.B53]MBW9214321.1 DUF222 domain-containing protein [Mumia sp. zg.B53]